MKARFAARFRKRMRKLPRGIQDRFWERLAIFLEDSKHPLLNDRSLAGEWAGCRSINVTGDFRAIYVIDSDVVRFLAIGTHPELYG